MSSISTSAFRRASLFLILTASALVPFSADARLAAGQGHVSFTAQGPAGMTIVGNSEALKVAEDQGNVKVSVALSTVTTGIALRDKHMHEKYLEVASYPNAEFSVARTALNVPAGGDAVDSTANGTMSIHGKSQPAAIRYVAKRTPAGFHVTGTVHVNMNDYGIATPSYMGVSVKPGVDINVAFDAADTP
jgi:polyisoprenoid-binding protein YceI